MPYLFCENKKNELLKGRKRIKIIIEGDPCAMLVVVCTYY